MTEINYPWEKKPASERAIKAFAVPIGAGIFVFVVCIFIAVGITVFKSKPGLLIEQEVSEPHALAQLEEISIFVHVAGSVISPGMVELKEGARVHDALAQAGGAGQDANLDSLNLARTLKDGEQIFVPSAHPSEEDQAAETESGLININRASQAELESLPGVGPALAGRIISWREANGSFVQEEDLMQVSGIGTKVFAQLQSLITI